MPRNDGSSYSIVECNARNFYEGFIPQSFIYNTLKQFLPSLNEYRNDFLLFECREYILQQVFVEWNLDESNLLQLRKRLLFGEYNRFYFPIKNRIIERYASLPVEYNTYGVFSIPMSCCERRIVFYCRICTYHNCRNNCSFLMYKHFRKLIRYRRWLRNVFLVSGFVYKTILSLCPLEVYIWSAFCLYGKELFV